MLFRSVACWLVPAGLALIGSLLPGGRCVRAPIPRPGPVNIRTQREANPAAWIQTH